MLVHKDNNRRADLIKDLFQPNYNYQNVVYVDARQRDWQEWDPGANHTSTTSLAARGELREGS